MISEVDGGVVIDVRVQPGAGRTSVVGRHGDALKLKVGAPPVGGRANEATLAFLAEQFDIPVSRVSLVSGPKDRSKRVRLDGIDEVTARAVIERMIDAVPKR
jgi:uncharacterized protein (TIGR00251 family)